MKRTWVALGLASLAGCSSAASSSGGGSHLTAHGTFVSPARDGGCPLDGTLLTATGDSGSVVGAQSLTGHLDTSGACKYPFSFAVKATSTVAFHAGAFRVAGHDAQVGADALAHDLVLFTL